MVIFEKKKNKVSEMLCAEFSSDDRGEKIMDQENVYVDSGELVDLVCVCLR